MISRGPLTPERQRIFVCMLGDLGGNDRVVRNGTLFPILPRLSYRVTIIYRFANLMTAT